MQDAKIGEELLKSVRERIKRIFADKGYDSKAIYNSFDENTVISTRKNSTSKRRRSSSRSKIVRQIRMTSEQEWKESVDYGKRWNVEIYFSGFKRTMGEVIKAVRPDYIAREFRDLIMYLIARGLRLKPES